MAARPTELKMAAPTVFDGNRSQTNQFISEIVLYLGVNDDVYNSDKKKIGFVLSYMKGGTAGPWKETKLNSLIDAGQWGNFANFLRELKTAFAPADEAGDARSKMKHLKQTGTADEYISEFRILASRSKITEDTSLVEYFMEGLNPKLVEKIFGLEDLPTTIDDWYKYAARLDNQWRRAKAIMARNQGNGNKDRKPIRFKNYAAPRYVAPDPNAMDTSMGRLTQEERNEHMKKGLCFECHKIGHRAIDHKTGTVNQKPRPNQEKPKMLPFGTCLRAMIDAQPEGEEREEGHRMLEDEGF